MVVVNSQVTNWLDAIAKLEIKSHNKSMREVPNYHKHHYTYYLSPVHLNFFLDIRVSNGMLLSLNVSSTHPTTASHLVDILTPQVAGRRPTKPYVCLHTLPILEHWYTPGINGSLRRY